MDSSVGAGGDVVQAVEESRKGGDMTTRETEIRKLKKTLIDDSVSRKRDLKRLLTLIRRDEREKLKAA